MHDLHLIHTDLKPENILLVSSEYIKVPDYKVMLQRFGFMLFSFLFCIFLRTLNMYLQV
jgi:serine/threonine protein kinase